MTTEDVQQLAAAVLETRGYNFGPAMDVIRPVVEKIVDRHESAEVFARLIVRDYRRLIMSIPDAEVTHV